MALNNRNGMAYWTTGNYLHRLYLDRNPLVSGVNLSSDNSEWMNLLETKITELKSKEDAALIQFDSFITGGQGSVNGGLRKIKNILKGSSGVINTLNEIARIAYEQNPDLDITSKEGKSKIVDLIIQYFNDEYSQNGQLYDRELGKIYSEIYERLVSEINSLTTDKGNISSLSGFKGLANEKLIHALMNYNIYNALESGGNKTSIDRAIEKLKDEAYLVSKNVGDNFVMGTNRRSSVDEIITIPLEDGLGEVPIQIKTKPKSNETSIQFVQRMEIDNLMMEARENAVTRRAIKTALINQHYWASGFYKRLVRGAAKNQGYDLPGNINSTHPTAIERLDEDSVIDPLKGIVKPFAASIMYNIITGIEDKIKVLFYVVVSRDGYTIIRSSDLLKNMFGKNGIKNNAINNMKTSGRMRIKTEPIIDESVEEFFSKPGRDGFRSNAVVGAPYERDEWYSATAGIVESVYQKMAITLSFNYGKIGSNVEEG